MYPLAHVISLESSLRLIVHIRILYTRRNIIRIVYTRLDAAVRAKDSGTPFSVNHTSSYAEVRTDGPKGNAMRFILFRRDTVGRATHAYLLWADVNKVYCSLDRLP